MEGFWSTAWRYLKGDLGELPSLLPARATIEKAKKEKRKVRLFCEGLEKFREILYVETVVEEGLSTTTGMIRGEEYHGEDKAIAGEKTGEIVFGAGEELFQATDEKDGSTPSSPESVSSTSQFLDEKYNHPPSSPDSEASASTSLDASDKHPPSSPDNESSTSQSLDEKDNHPPSSPDSESSATTSLDSSDKSTPSSPSTGSSASTLTDTTGAEVEPSAIITKDFAYSSLDWRHLGPSVLVDDKDEDETPQKSGAKAEPEDGIEDACQKEVGPEVKTEEEVVKKVDVSEDGASACVPVQQVPKSSTDDDDAEVYGVNATVGRGADVASLEQGGDLVTSQASVLDDKSEKFEDSELQSEEANQTEGQNDTIEHHLPTLDGQKVDLINDQCSSESSGGAPISEANHNDSQPPAEQSDSKREGDDASTDDQVQGTCGSDYWQGHETFEFPEAAGPATVWGILRDSQYEHEAEDEGADDVAQMTRVSEAAGPATLWEILESEHSENVGEKREEAEETAADIDTTLDKTLVGSNDDDEEQEWEVPHKHEAEYQGEDHATQMTGVSGAADLATLWGNLPLEHSKSVGEERKKAEETAADTPTTDEAPISDDDNDGGEGDKEEVPQAPTNTPALVPIDKDDETDNSSSEVTTVQESAAGTSEASLTEVPGPEAAQTEELTEPSTVLSEADNVDDPSKSSESDTFAHADESHAAIPDKIQSVEVSDGEDVSAPAVDTVVDENADESEAAIPDKIQSVEVTDGENVSAPAVNTVVGENSHRADQPTNDVALKSSSVTSAQEGDSDASENTSALQIPTDIIVSSSPPHAPSPSQVEQSDSIPPVIQTRKPNKAQQRALARRRGAQTKMEATELKRRVEGKGADTPEARAQVQAEADAKIGERKLKLQAARELSWPGKGAHVRR